MSTDSAAGLPFPWDGGSGATSSAQEHHFQSGHQLLEGGICSSPCIPHICRRVSMSVNFQCIRWSCLRPSCHHVDSYAKRGPPIGHLTSTPLIQPLSQVRVAVSSQGHCRGRWLSSGARGPPSGLLGEGGAQVWTSWCYFGSEQTLHPAYAHLRTRPEPCLTAQQEGGHGGANSPGVGVGGRATGTPQLSHSPGPLATAPTLGTRWPGSGERGHQATSGSCPALCPDGLPQLGNAGRQRAAWATVGSWRPATSSWGSGVGWQSVSRVCPGAGTVRDHLYHGARNVADLTNELSWSSARVPGAGHTLGSGPPGPGCPPLAQGSSRLCPGHSWLVKGT